MIFSGMLGIHELCYSRILSSFPLLFLIPKQIELLLKFSFIWFEASQIDQNEHEHQAHDDLHQHYQPKSTIVVIWLHLSITFGSKSLVALFVL